MAGQLYDELFEDLFEDQPGAQPSASAESQESQITSKTTDKTITPNEALRRLPPRHLPPPKEKLLLNDWVKTDIGLRDGRRLEIHTISWSLSHADTVLYYGVGDFAVGDVSLATLMQS
ncbi:hypothetical protein DdX_10832 [Ditylenchus destructor]|uniref:Uncharacterized protein n=1 Tax=Ditylenchus destructor TaxID=166010 RepID=A0AAD4R525_9BILA|nr:hypothetical protein DdX_10832 [Ditylenchus destructor]